MVQRQPDAAVRETFALAVFLGYVLFFVERRTGWMIAFAALAYFSIPTGGLWILIIPSATLLVWRDETRPNVTPAFAAVAGVVAFGITAPWAIRLLGLPIPGSEFGLAQTINRIRYVSFTDWERIAYLVLPGGIVPAVALFA